MSSGTGLNGNIKAESDEEEWPLSASWGHHMPHKSQDTVHVVNEGILAYELLLALQVRLAHASRGKQSRLLQARNNKQEINSGMIKV